MIPLLPYAIWSVHIPFRREAPHQHSEEPCAFVVALYRFCSCGWSIAEWCSKWFLERIERLYLTLRTHAYLLKHNAAELMSYALPFRLCKEMPIPRQETRLPMGF